MALLAIRRRITCTPADEALAATPLGVTLMDLSHRTCRWPTSGEGEHTLFCGHTRAVGSYCAAHAVRSQGRGTETERSAHRAGRAAA